MNKAKCDECKYVWINKKFWPTAAFCDKIRRFIPTYPVPPTWCPRAEEKGEDA